MSPKHIILSHTVLVSNKEIWDSYILYVNYPYTHVPFALKVEFVVKDRNQVYFDRRKRTIWNIHGKNQITKYQ